MLGDTAKIALTLIHALGLMALVSLVFGQLQRLPQPPVVRNLLCGFVFGLGAYAAMLDPFTVAGGGVYVDGRNLFVAFSAAFAGAPGALVAGVMVAIARTAMGGIGLASGLTALVIAAGVGLAWRQYVEPRVVRPSLSLGILGLGVSLTTVTYVLLPADLALRLLTTATPALVVSSVVAAFTLGAFVQRENAMIEREAQLSTDAETDPLTTLLNRRAFERVLARAGAESGGAMLIVDVDRFKSVNDTHGHSAGDEVLKGLARILHDAVRGSDIVARIGGEEFAAFLPGALLKDARRVAERIRSSVSDASFPIGSGVVLKVTVSVGASWTPRLPAYDDMFRRADTALYLAKETGRNRVEFAPALGQAA